MKNKLKIFILLPFILFLVACKGYEDPDGKYMVSALGVSKNGAYTFYIEAVSIGTDNSTADPRLFSYTADTLKDAQKGINNLLSKKIMFEHCAAALLENGLPEKQKVMEFLLKEGINPSACVVYCESAQDILSAKPEHSAVGYDIMGLIRKEKIDGCRLFYVLNGKINPPEFINSDGAVGVKKNGK